MAEQLVIKMIHVSNQIILKFSLYIFNKPFSMYKNRINSDHRGYKIKIFMPQTLSIFQLPLPSAKRTPTDLSCSLLLAVLSCFSFLIALSTIIINPINNQFNIIDNLIIQTNQQPLCQSRFLFVQIASKNKQCVDSCPIDFIQQKGVCFPESSIFQSELNQNVFAQKQMEFYESKQILFISIVFSILVGMILWVIFAICPLKSINLGLLTIYTALLLNCILVTLIVSRYFNQNHQSMSYTIIFLPLLIIFSYSTYRLSTQKDINQYHHIFLNYSQIFLKTQKNNYLWAFIAYATSALFTLKIVFQHVCFMGNQYWLLVGLNFIEAIWGFRYVKDLMISFVKGKCIQWYFQRQENQGMKRIMKHHGSCAAGSLINGAFQNLSHILSLIQYGLWNQQNNYENWLNFVNRDTYTMINLTGLPYCSASRQYMQLFHRLEYLTKSPSIKSYEFLMKWSVICLWVLLLSYYCPLGVHTIGMLLIYIVLYSQISMTMSIAYGCSQSLQTCFLLEHRVEADYQFKPFLHPQLKNHVKQVEQRILGSHKH